MLSPQRLRRDLRGFAAGYAMEIVLLPLAAFAAWAFIVESPTFVGAGFAVALAGLVAWAYVPSRVLLDEACLDAGHRFSSKRTTRLRLDRVDVSHAVAGGVYWGRGGDVSGIEIVTHDGELHDLPMSALLGDSRRQAWIAAINNWAAMADRAS